MSVDNEAIGFLILWGLVIVAAVFVVRLFRGRNLCPNCGGPVQARDAPPAEIRRSTSAYLGRYRPEAHPNCQMQTVRA